MWILEAQRFNNRGADSVGGKSTGWLHVGYMNIAFPTKRRAAEYYDMHNSHMRGLNAHNTWRSDYDPDTFLRYVVRSYNNEELTVVPFDPADAPKPQSDCDLMWT